MKVYIIPLGTMEIDRNCMLNLSTRATKTNPNVPAVWIQIPVWGALIDTGDHKILFDLGCLPDAMEPTGWPPRFQNMMPIYRKEDEYLEKQLAKINLTPADIDTVILSHLHIDHFGGIEQFTHCDVYLPKEDWVNALVKNHENMNPANGGTYINRCIETRVKQYHPIVKGDDFELFPGIDLISLPGHVENLLGLVVHTEDQVLIFPSDALAMQETYDSSAAMSGPFDAQDALRSIEKIRRLERKYNAKVMISHSMQFFDSLKKIPEYYK